MEIIEHLPKNDISIINAWLVNEIPPAPGAHPRAQPTRTHTFSAFNNDYEWGREREFIEQLEKQNPGLYFKCVISWVDSN